MTTSRASRTKAPPPEFARRASRGEPPYEVLKQAILHGEVEPDAPLVEATLAAWCRVSRTPIREALTRLEQDGLVYRSDRGVMVRKRSPEEVLDVYEVRLVLEATASRIAAERRTEHELHLLRRLLTQEDEVADGDAAAMAETNRMLHHAVWRASHNESLIDLLRRLDLHLARYPETTLSYENRWAEAKQEHQEIVDAIAARDGERAYQIAHRHFAEARDIRLALYDGGSVLGM